MCKRNKWKKGILGVGLAAACFLAVPSGAYATQTEGAPAGDPPAASAPADPADQPGADSTPGTPDAAVTPPADTTPKAPADLWPGQCLQLQGRRQRTQKKRLQKRGF